MKDKRCKTKDVSFEVVKIFKSLDSDLHLTSYILRLTSYVLHLLSILKNQYFAGTPGFGVVNLMKSRRLWLLVSRSGLLKYIMCPLR